MNKIQEILADICENLIMAINETNTVREEEFINILENLHKMAGMSENNLKKEREKVKSVIKICRHVVLGWKQFVQDSNDAVLEKAQVDFLRKQMNILRDTLLYGHMPAIWILETYLANTVIRIEAGDKYYPKVERISPLSEMYVGGDIRDQQKRRYENNHTIKMQLRNLWGIEINGEERDREYEKLCDLIESIISKVEDINVDNNGSRRLNSRIRLFQLLDRKSMPLDLFDAPIGDDIFGQKYRSIIQDLIFELERLAGIMSSAEYLDTKRFWKNWYSKTIEGIYSLACTENDKDIVQAQYNMVKKIDATNAEKEHFQGSLYSEILFNLLKEEMKNDLMGFRYILENASVIGMEPLNEKVKTIFESLIEGREKYDYDKMEIFIQNNIEEIKLLLGDNVDVDMVFNSTKRLLEQVLYPQATEIPIEFFLVLMQCCVVSLESELTIKHFGMSRGIKLVKLKTMIKRPVENTCKESRLFLMYMMRRRYFMNIFDVDTADVIDRYRLTCEANLMVAIEYTGDWKGLKVHRIE